MTTLAERTARKYRGKFAEGYRAKRESQRRWKEENEIVERFLSDLPPGTTVLDVPVGEGRFISLYSRRQFSVVGVDVSEDMLKLARRKRTSTTTTLAKGSIFELPYDANTFDVGVCVRFLDLLDQDNMERAMLHLDRVVRSRIILTIRLGEKYVLKTNTATHDRERWYDTVDSYAWKVEEAVPVLSQGWHVMKLTR